VISTDSDNLFGIECGEPKGSPFSFLGGLRRRGAEGMSRKGVICVCELPLRYALAASSAHSSCSMCGELGRWRLLELLVSGGLL
jgi:hypothetical protein